MNYFLAVGGEQRGPFPKEQLLGQGLRPETLVWTDGMPQWQRADSVLDLASLFGAAPVVAAPVAYASVANVLTAPSRDGVSSTKLAAGLCAILIGALGIHKFIIGATTAGVITLVISLATCGVGAVVFHVIGIIEGIIYLTKSDEEFYQTYMIRKKAWF
jgi:TM2 domain-containing membrane protein YozV